MNGRVDRLSRCVLSLVFNGISAGLLRFEQVSEAQFVVRHGVATTFGAVTFQLFLNRVSNFVFGSSPGKACFVVRSDPH